MRRRRRVGALALVVAVTVLGGFASGCKKDKEALILIDLQAMDTGGTGVVTVEITVGEPAPSDEIVASPIFDLPAGGLPMSPAIEYGVYVKSGVTGRLPVTAVAKPATGCLGYRGMATVTVTEGGTASVSLTLSPQDVCGGGSCGTVVGTKPATVPAPTALATCMEYDTQPGVACDPLGTVNNPWINWVAVSPDGTLLATAIEDANRDGKVKIFRLNGNTPTPCAMEITGPASGPGYVAFSPNGQLFAVAWTGAYVDIFKVPSFEFIGEAQSSGNDPIYGVGFSADSQVVLSVDWDQGTDGFLRADSPDGTMIGSAMLGLNPDSMAVSPVAVGGGTAIVVPGYDGNVGYYTWNGSSFSAPVILPTVAGRAGTRAAFSPNGMLLAESTDDGAVRFWNTPITATSVPTGSNIMLGDIPLAISFSPGNDFVAFAYNVSFDIWSVASRSLVARHNVTGTFADSVSFTANGGAIIGGEDRCGRFLVCSN